MTTPWAEPLLVNVTWDPPLLRHGLPGTFPWGGGVALVRRLLADAGVAAGAFAPFRACRKRCDGPLAPVLASIRFQTASGSP